MRKIKYILYLAAIVLLFSSCKKDELTDKSKTSEYYLTVDIDGKTTSFNNSIPVVHY